MKKSLNINAIRGGKKVSKNIGYVNPDAPNSLVGGFAQMVNALTNDTFVNAEVVKRMDTTEEEQSGGGTPAPAPAKTEPTLTVTKVSGDVCMYDGNAMFGDYNGNPCDAVASITYNGDGQLYIGNFVGNDYNGTNQSVTLINNTLKVKSDAYKNWFFNLYASEGTNYAAKVLRCEVETED